MRARKLKNTLLWAVCFSVMLFFMGGIVSAVLMLIGWTGYAFFEFFFYNYLQKRKIEKIRKTYVLMKDKMPDADNADIENKTRKYLMERKTKTAGILYLFSILCGMTVVFLPGILQTVGVSEDTVNYAKGITGLVRGIICFSSGFIFAKAANDSFDDMEECFEKAEEMN